LAFQKAEAISWRFHKSKNNIHILPRLSRYIFMGYFKPKAPSSPAFQSGNHCLPKKEQKNEKIALFLPIRCLLFSFIFP